MTRYYNYENEECNFQNFEEAFYDYIRSPGWNCVEIGFRGIDYQFSWGDNIYYVDRDGVQHSYEFPPDVETLMDAHVLENGMSPRELMRRNDLEYFSLL